MHDININLNNIYFVIYLYLQQLQPWSTVGAAPCMEQVAGSPIPSRIGQYYQTPRPHPWRPTLGYENVEVSPL